jgi:hypothetical protein
VGFSRCRAGAGPEWAEVAARGGGATAVSAFGDLAGEARGVGDAFVPSLVQAVLEVVQDAVALVAGPDQALRFWSWS